MSELYVAAGSSQDSDFELAITPKTAHWQHTSLRILELSAGDEKPIETGSDEVVVVPLSGSATVQADGSTIQLRGRVSVFDGPTDFAYLPIHTAATLSSEAGGRFALCGARTDQRLTFRYGPVDQVSVEHRGAGQASRQVRNFATPEAFEAGSLIACEVITPAGNWSSYPAHKHDETSEHESELEEIYYFEIAAGPHGEPGFGLHRTSASPGHDIDFLAEVHDRDAVLVPYGWHGPCVAAPGFDMYYLNVMAGPGDERAWKITDHPDQTWVRDTWADLPFDPRLGSGESE